jgi:hypothetical protein
VASNAQREGFSGETLSSIIMSRAAAIIRKERELVVVGV